VLSKIVFFHLKENKVNAPLALLVGVCLDS